MEYRSINDLNNLIVKSLYKIPRDVDLVVGIPRSGLFAANLIALYLNIPFTDIDGFVNGRIIDTGERYKRSNGFKDINDINNFKKILVVDDSVSSGKSLREVKEKIKKAGMSLDVLYFTVYISSESKRMVDIYLQVCKMPRVFEWNIMHHSVLSKSCVDFDGVLCPDPTEEENDDGKRYREFILKTPPLFLPTVKIKYLVTCRLEKYRKETEEWLAGKNVDYEKLIMMDLPSKEERVRLSNHAQFKADIYRKTKTKLFIESCDKQAVDIANLSGKCVYSLESKDMIYPGSFIAKKKVLFKNSFLSKLYRQQKMIIRCFIKKK